MGASPKPEPTEKNKLEFTKGKNLPNENENAPGLGWQRPGLQTGRIFPWQITSLNEQKIGVEHL